MFLAKNLEPKLFRQKPDGLAENVDGALKQQVLDAHQLDR